MQQSTNVLAAKSRTGKGKGPARRLRAEGLIPAVVYGQKRDPTHIAVDPAAIAPAIATPHKFNTLLTLQLDGAEKRVLFQDWEVDPVSRKLLHADFLEVDMGKPILEGRKIPVNADGKILNYPLAVDGATYSVTCVSMGNPHCVLYVDDVDRLELEKIGPRFEHHPFFPRRVNTEFVRVLSPREVRVRVWERGAGETWACGTGACAVGVAGALAGKTEKKITVHLRGGDLAIEWRDNNHVYMTGGAEEVFRGTIKI